MRLNKFPLCCKSGIISSFPEGDQHSHDRMSYEKMVSEFARKIMEADLNGYVQVIVILNENQDMARRMIRSLEEMDIFNPLYSAELSKTKVKTSVYDYIETYVIPLNHRLISWATISWAIKEGVE